MTDAIRFEVKDTVAELCLCGPERRNAIGSREIALVKAAIDSIPDTCRLFVIRSEGSVFCAGANLKEIADGTMEGGRERAESRNAHRACAHCGT